MQKYNTSNVKHRFPIDRDCNLQNIHIRIIRCWKRNFDKTLLTNCMHKCLVWIYRWSCWVTCWQPAQFKWVGSLPSNHTWVAVSRSLATRAADLAMVWFRPGPRPEVTVWIWCYHYHGGCAYVGLNDASTTCLAPTRHMKDVCSFLRPMHYFHKILWHYSHISLPLNDGCNMSKRVIMGGNCGAPQPNNVGTV